VRLVDVERRAGLVAEVVFLEDDEHDRCFRKMMDAMSIFRSCRADALLALPRCGPDGLRAG
jgi:hypothetical protein